MTNKTIRIAAILLLAAIMMTSLTSCVFDFGFKFEDYIPEFDYNQNFGENILPDLNDSEQEITSKNYGEFYPGSGQGSTDGVQPLSKTLLSTVTIICGSNLSASAGSGVIYSIDKEKGDAYIVTNCHVLYGSGKTVASEIKVYLYGMELSSYAIPATFVGGSINYDIAVIKISGSDVLKNSYATAVQFEDSDNIRVFDRVYAVGNAEGAGISATEGIVSVTSENINLSGADGSVISLRVIRIDAAVNHGNSGGGLYNEQGKLVGIVSAKEVSEDIDNMGYAIPSDLVERLAKSIIHHCNGSDKTQTDKALMGITITAYVSGAEIDKNGKVYEVELVEVTEISAGSLAEGKVLVGDVINSITVDGVKTTVTRIHHVTDAMIDARVGSVVVLNITRDGKTMDITFTVPTSSITAVR
jgi:serine protease Do